MTRSDSKSSLSIADVIADFGPVDTPAPCCKSFFNYSMASMMSVGMLACWLLRQKQNKTYSMAMFRGVRLVFGTIRFTFTPYSSKINAH